MCVPADSFDKLVVGLCVGVVYHVVIFLVYLISGYVVTLFYWLLAENDWF